MVRLGVVSDSGLQCSGCVADVASSAAVAGASSAAVAGVPSSAHYSAGAHSLPLNHYRGYVEEVVIRELQ